MNNLKGILKSKECNFTITPLNSENSFRLIVYSEPKYEVLVSLSDFDELSELKILEMFRDLNYTIINGTSENSAILYRTSDISEVQEYYDWLNELYIDKINKESRDCISVIELQDLLEIARGSIDITVNKSGDFVIQESLMLSTNSDLGLILDSEILNILSSHGITLRNNLTKSALYNGKNIEKTLKGIK